MKSNKDRLRPGDISIIGTLLILPGFIVVFLFFLFYIGIDRDEDVDTAESASVGQPTLSEDAAIIATLNAIPARTAIPRDINSDSSQAVAETMNYSDEIITSGRENYLAVCSACHGADSRGISGLGKGLINSEYVRGKTDQELLDFVIVGRAIWDAENTTGVAMPARGGNPILSDQEILNIIAYIRVLDGYVPEGQVAAVPTTDNVTENVDTTSDTTDEDISTPSDDEDGESFVAIDILSGDNEDTSNDTTDVSARDGATLYSALCENDDASQAMCNFLVDEIAGGADETRITDLLTNGSSPFDTSIPSDIFVPQRGGALLLTDGEVQNVVIHLFGLAGVETAITPPTDDSDTTTDMSTDPSGRDGETVYTELCGVDDSSQAMCDFLIAEISGGGDQARITDLLTNGSSPFDTSIPEGIFIPQRGGSLLLTDADIQNLVVHLFTLAGVNTPSVDTSTNDNTTTGMSTDPSGRDGETVYTELCGVDDSSQAMCDFLVDEIAGGADEARITDLLTNGSSPFDSSIPEGIFVPQRGGALLLTDADIQNLVVHLFTLAGANTPSVDTSTDDGTATDASTDVSGRDGATIYAALCEVDDASQAMCDYLVNLISEGATRERIDDLLINGSSPFDSSIPEGIFIPQRGGSLLLTGEELQSLADYFYELAGVEVGRLTDPLDQGKASDEVIFVPQSEGEAIYDDLCHYNASREAMCEYLSRIISEGAGWEHIIDLLTNGGSPMDLSIPDDIFIPVRGGRLLFSDADIRTLTEYLYSEAGVELAINIENPATGSLYTTDSLARMSYVTQLQGSVISPPRELVDFTLPSTTGEDFTLSEHGGKIIMVYFGYLSCPDVCPATLADMRRAYLEIGEPSEDILGLFITLDPERDTLENLGRYVNAFHGDFIGLRPTSIEQLEALKANFGVFSESRDVDSGTGYLIDHSATVFLITPDGRIVSQFPFGVSYREISNDLQVMMDYTLSPSEAAEATAIRVPVDDPTREYRIIIPEGTTAQIAMGNDPGIIPLTINLTIGERDVLVLENHDNSDFLVGGVWVAPYETVRKQFYEAQTFVGLCTVTVGRDLVEIVVVEPE